MQVHNQDWDSAEEHDSNSVHDVLVDQVKVAFKAKDLAKFESLLLRTRGPELAILAGPKLVQISPYKAVAQPYLGGEMIKEAVDTIITGEEWAKVKGVAKELEPRLEACVDEKYKYFRKNERKTEQFADVGLSGAPEMHVDQVNWKKAVSTASEHGPVVLHKQVAMYATQLIKEVNITGALQIYKKKLLC